MGKPVRVSVLITSYNLEAYIEEALKSVLMQETDFAYEILVGDDGSKDGTMEILQDYERRFPEKIRIFTMPREEGKKYNPVHRAAANRLNLLKEAAGEYCSFLDGDDYYTDPHRLQRMAGILDRPENADCIMCAHNLSMVWTDGSSSALCSAKKERKLKLADYWKLMFVQANALLFRNIYKTHRPEGALARNFDDNNITFWLFQYGSMYYLPECMGAYRQLESSSWNMMDSLHHSALNMMGYNVELLTAPQCRALSDIRHYPDLVQLYEHRGEYRAQDLSPFYENALEDGMEEALLVYRAGELGAEEQKQLKRRLDKARRGYLLARLQRAFLKLFGQY